VGRIALGKASRRMNYPVAVYRYKWRAGSRVVRSHSDKLDTEEAKCLSPEAVTALHPRNVVVDSHRLQPRIIQ
jgi:hypothetical protein